MNQPTSDEVAAVLNRMERTRIELVSLPETRRLPPLASMEWSEAERQRLRTFSGQMTRYRKRSVLARLLGWVR